ncbi:hypothetical protein [Kitasatospora griseola]|uniref:hypothetical protein n=1 Tax=Kitasatospora griseola TaxID=2064 RepID=UPI0034174700
MISFGSKVVDREDAAKLVGKAAGTLRNLGFFKVLTPVAGGGRGTKELYDLEQTGFLAIHMPRTKGAAIPEVPALTDPAALAEGELRELVRRVLTEEKNDGVVNDLTSDQVQELDEQELRAWVRGRELLTLEEARLVIPEERRPTKSTMESYYRGSKATRLPDPDAVFYGVAFWLRATIERWNAQERRAAHGIKGHGRPARTIAAPVVVTEPAVEAIVTVTPEASAPQADVHQILPAAASTASAVRQAGNGQAVTAVVSAPGATSGRTGAARCPAGGQIRIRMEVSRGYAEVTRKLRTSEHVIATAEVLDGETAWINRISVAPVHQGHGHATALLLAVLRPFDDVEIALAAVPFEAPASRIRLGLGVLRAWYARHGFEAAPLRGDPDRIADGWLHGRGHRPGREGARVGGVRGLTRGGETRLKAVALRRSRCSSTARR